MVTWLYLALYYVNVIVSYVHTIYVYVSQSLCVSLLREQHMVSGPRRHCCFCVTINSAAMSCCAFMRTAAAAAAGTPLAPDR